MPNNIPAYFFNNEKYHQIIDSLADRRNGVYRGTGAEEMRREQYELIKQKMMEAPLEYLQAFDQFAEGKCAWDVIEVEIDDVNCPAWYPVRGDRDRFADNPANEYHAALSQLNYLLFGEEKSQTYGILGIKVRDQVQSLQYAKEKFQRAAEHPEMLSVTAGKEFSKKTLKDFDARVKQELAITKEKSKENAAARKMAMKDKSLSADKRLALRELDKLEKATLKQRIKDIRMLSKMERKMVVAEEKIKNNYCCTDKELATRASLEEARTSLLIDMRLRAKAANKDLIALGGKDLPEAVKAGVNSRIAETKEQAEASNAGYLNRAKNSPPPVYPESRLGDIEREIANARAQRTAQMSEPTVTEAKPVRRPVQIEKKEKADRAMTKPIEKKDAVKEATKEQDAPAVQ